MEKKYIYQNADKSKFVLDDNMENDLKIEINKILSDLKFRKKYKVHDISKISRNNITNRREEWICKITCKEKPNIDKNLGKVIEFQIPLKIPGNKEYSVGRGKVDLISVNDNNKKIYLIEFKVSTNSENPWKAFLEIYTYYNMLGGKGKSTEFLSKLDIKYKGYKLVPIVLFEISDDNNIFYNKMLKEQDAIKKFAKKHSIKCYSCKANNYIINDIKEVF